MPQGDETGTVQKSTYQRKRQNVRRSGAQGTGGLAAQINPNFLKALPSMTRDIERMAAGKLLQSGATLKLRDIRESGNLEKKSNAKRKRANPVTALLGRTKNLKGVKGTFNVEELAELDPELKALMEKRKATSGGGKRAKTAATTGSTKVGGEGGEEAWEGEGGEGGEGGEDGGGGGAAGEASRGSGMPSAPLAGGRKGGRGRVAALMANSAGGVDTTSSVFATDKEVAGVFGADFL